MPPCHPLVRRISRCGRLLVCLAAAAFAAGAHAQGAGYWHTSGSRILDENNRQVRIAGINWYGFETPAGAPGGLNAQDYKSILRTIKAQGFNTIRIPLSSQTIETPSVGSGIAYSNAAGPMNADLQGLNSMEVLDRIVAYSGSIGLKIILDHHRSEAGSSAEASGLWYTAAYPESAWIADWTALAYRYLGNPTVIGFDLHNEPHSVKPGGACWDCGGTDDWHLAAERAGNAVLAANPNLLVFVEGVDAYNGDFYWWGGNLEGVQKSPVVLSQPNHLVYSAHEYGPKESAQTWFNASTTSSSLTNAWVKHWAYISQSNLAPVWLGEFGSTNSVEDLQSNAPGSQGQWFQSLVAFLRNNENISWNYWAVNGEDGYALLDGKYESAPASEIKQSMLSSLDFPLVTATPTPAAPQALKVHVVSTSQINLDWSPVAGTNVAYNVYFGTSPANIATVVAAGLTSTSVQATNLNCCTVYYFAVKAVSQGIASAPSNQVSARTQTANPRPPVGLTAIAQSASQINLAWLAVAAAGIGYTIYSGTNANNIGSVLADGLTTPSYQVSNLRPSTNYFFKVKAVEQGIVSTASNAVSATTKPPAQPAAPGGLVAAAGAGSAVNLRWQPSATPGVLYNIYASTMPGGMGSLLAGGVNANAYQSAKLNPETTYYFTVRAVVSGFTSSASNSASATTEKAAETARHVDLSAGDDWGTGFIARIAITNTGATPITSWTLSWTYPGNQHISKSWAGNSTQAGESITLTDAGFNSTIPPNTTSTGIGFQATYTGRNVTPSVFYLNGVECQ